MEDNRYYENIEVEEFTEFVARGNEEEGEEF